MHTCAIGVPATSSTGTTLSGLCGLATSGPSSSRSISTRSSYSQPSSGPISAKSSSRSWRFSQSRVWSSGGKTAEVAPSSAIMFAIVPRSGIERSAVPGPVNSKTLFLPPVVVGVLEVERDDVVVDVLHGPADLDARHVELLELHERHRPGGVLQQRLVDADADRLARDEVAVDEVLLEDLTGQVLGHRALPTRSPGRQSRPGGGGGPSA